MDGKPNLIRIFLARLITRITLIAQRETEHFDRMSCSCLKSLEGVCGFLGKCIILYILS